MSWNRLLLLIGITTLSQFALAQSARLHALSEQDLPSPSATEQVQMLEGHPMAAKLMVLSGGDPALNGRHLFLAVNTFSTGSGPWNTYYLKDVRDYTVLPSAQPGYLKIQLENDAIDEDGNLRPYRSVLFINMTQADKANGHIETKEVVPNKPL